MTRPVPASRASATATLYLQIVGTTWHARIPVPADLRPTLGPYLRKSLRTSDLREAQRRRWDFLEVARKRFDQARATREAPRSAPVSARVVEDRVGYDAEYAKFRAKLIEEVGPATVVNAFDGEEISNPAFDALIDKVRGHYSEREYDDATSPIIEAMQDHARDLDPISVTLASYMKANPKRSETTHRNFNTTVDSWTEAHGDRPLGQVSRKQALAWIEGVGEGKARDTIRRYINNMKTLWDWAHRGLDDVRRNPFDGLLKDFGGGGKPAQPHGFYTDEELRRIDAALAPDRELHPVFRIAVYTGFRLSEVLRAKREVIHGVPCFLLKVGKTVNAYRVVPEHPQLRGIEAPSNVKPSALSVRYGRVTKKIGIPRGKTFHSLRKVITTALENVHCPEAVAARLLGHTPLGVTYKIYSEGKNARNLKGWMDQIALPLCDDTAGIVPALIVPSVSRAT